MINSICNLLAQSTRTIAESSFFDTSFWQQLLVTSAGVIFGIPFALWLNRKQVRREETKQTETSRTHEKEIRELLCRAIEGNKSLLQQMTTELRQMAIFYNVDLLVFESLPSTEILRATNLAVSEKLAHLRYELTHLHRKIELQLTIEFDGTLRQAVKVIPGEPILTRYDIMRNQLVGAIYSHLPSIITACEDTFGDISRISGESTQQGPK